MVQRRLRGSPSHRCTSRKRHYVRQGMHLQPIASHYRPLPTTPASKALPTTDSHKQPRSRNLTVPDPVASAPGASQHSLQDTRKCSDITENAVLSPHLPNTRATRPNKMIMLMQPDEAHTAMLVVDFPAYPALYSPSLKISHTFASNIM